MLMEKQVIYQSYKESKWLQECKDKIQVKEKVYSLLLAQVHCQEKLLKEKKKYGEEVL